MNTLVILISLSLFLIVSYFLFGRRLSAPAILFIAPLILAVLDGFIYYKQWRFNLSCITSLLVIFGTLSFIVGCASISLFYRRVTISSVNKVQRIYLDNKVYALFFVLCILCSAATFLSIRQLVVSFGYPASSFSDIIGSYNELSKFGDEDISVHGIGAYAYEVVFGIGLVFAYLAARDIAIAHARCSKPCVLVFLTSALCVLIEGSRSVAITMFVAFAVLFLMFLQATNQLKRFSDIKAQTIVLVPGIILVAAIVFLNSLNLLGREGGSETSTPLYDLSIYLGAPLKNLDLALLEGTSQPSFFGQGTFRYLYSTLAKFGFDAPPYSTDFGFRAINGYFLGNVYTAFYNPIVDFGFIGGCFALFLTGMFVQLIYEYSYNHICLNRITFSSVVYGFFAYNIFFSFFADMFLATFFSTVALKKIVVVAFLIFVLNRFQLHEGKGMGVDEHLRY